MLQKNYQKICYQTLLCGWKTPYSSDFIAKNYLYIGENYHISGKRKTCRENSVDKKP